MLCNIIVIGIDPSSYCTRNVMTIPGNFDIANLVVNLYLVITGLLARSITSGCNMVALNFRSPQTQEGFADTETGACRLCDGMDYSVLSIIFLGVVMGVTILHFALMQDDRKQPRSLMVVLLGFIQFVTMVQMMAVLRRFEISWREPFASVLRLIEVLSIDIEPWCGW